MARVYKYEGPVYYFRNKIDDKFFGITTAASEKAARNNLTYRYKMEKGFEPNARITLTGKIEAVS